MDETNETLNKKLKLDRDISIPMDETNETLNKKLKLEIEEGRTEIEELIVPRSYDKVVISNGQVSTEKV